MDEETLRTMMLRFESINLNSELTLRSVGESMAINAMIVSILSVLGPDLRRMVFANIARTKHVLMNRDDRDKAIIADAFDDMIAQFQTEEDAARYRRT